MFLDLLNITRPPRTLGVIIILQVQSSYGVEGKNYDSSLQQETSHIYTIRLDQIKISIFIYILVKSLCFARFYHKLIEYIFYKRNNNQINNYYNNKRNKFYWYNNLQI